jgi:hypothetical protein
VDGGWDGRANSKTKDRNARTDNASLILTRTPCDALGPFFLQALIDSLHGVASFVLINFCQGFDRDLYQIFCVAVRPDTLV